MANTRFFKRNALHNMKITDKVATTDDKTAKVIEGGGYCPNQVFNAVETGLFWKKILSQTYMAKSEKKSSSFKASKDRVMMLLCSSVSKDRVLKPLPVIKSLRPHALEGKDLKQLPQ